MSFSKELVRRREKAGYSQREAARNMGITHATLGRYERGIGLMQMRLEHAYAIQQLYGWEPADMQRKIAREERDHEPEPRPKKKSA